MTDDDNNLKNRRAQRSRTLMTATLEISGRSVGVTLRNLSSDGAQVEGAQIEGAQMPVEGTELLFRKGDLALPGSVIWTKGKQAGIRFAEPLDPATVMNHMPAPRPRQNQTADFRRPGLTTRALTEQEKALARRLIPIGPVPNVDN